MSGGGGGGKPSLPDGFFQDLQRAARPLLEIKGSQDSGLQQLRSPKRNQDPQSRKLVASQNPNSPPTGPKGSAAAPPVSEVPERSPGQQDLFGLADVLSVCPRLTARFHAL